MTKTSNFSFDSTAPSFTVTVTQDGLDNLVTTDGLSGEALKALVADIHELEALAVRLGQTPEVRDLQSKLQDFTGRYWPAFREMIATDNPLLNPTLLKDA